MWNAISMYVCADVSIERQPPKKWNSDLSDEIKQDFFQASNTTLWIHHMDTNKTHGEKARWELHKNAAYSLEQILKAKVCKKIAVRPPASHLTNHLGKTNKYAKHCRKIKEKLNSDVFLWTPTHGRASVDRPVRTYIRSVRTQEAI